MKIFLKKLFQKVGLIGIFYRLNYKLGFTSMMPSTYIRSIPIYDNNESLVPIQSSEKIIVFCPDEEITLVRKIVLNKIISVSSNLPNGFKLKVLYGYRGPQVQKKFWEEACLNIRQKNPKLTEQEIEAEARRYSATPNGKGPHQTGGAVDVLIVDKMGNSLDFGTEYRGYGDKVPMYSKSITPEQRRNRKILRKIMQSANFVNYPGEWWHYSFGDQTWAAYTGKQHALCGFI